jgi:hypothetical protein
VAAKAGPAKIDRRDAAAERPSLPRLTCIEAEPPALLAAKGLRLRALKPDRFARMLHELRNRLRLGPAPSIFVGDHPTLGAIMLVCDGGRHYYVPVAGAV